MNDQKQNSDQPRLIATWLSVFPIVYILWFLVGFKFVLEQLAIVNKVSKRSLNGHSLFASSLVGYGRKPLDSLLAG